ncbi:hypothetical protein [Mycobacterium haemophilum]|uniref:Uncharacterized protein n=2 Tax=Mycobacterium haemophilum TaxID=29311 RepID=A0A0I9UY63_9MYCO|nr:hypothetical protein [Mycobacterium haemophilum]KLO26664.1 hypothetical protein ABH39_17300 [Mycobacterium haemophilum]KLO34784.1 hypothetical protein ABH38_17760 [Mycobacterium haemophilum]KLO39716.1 hypothetical protein ABH37_17580 [Mycobacterium haemophilum]KLO46835.1 hypothetical protein ABH36_17690 [Mycobacterium haemophilum]
MSVQCGLDLVFEVLFVVRLSEHLADVGAIGLRELPSGLAGSLLVEDPLYRVEYVAAVFRRGQISQRSILVNHGDNLWHFGFRRLFRILDLFDLFITLFS